MNQDNETETTVTFNKGKTNVRRIGYLFLFLFGSPSRFSLVLGGAVVLAAIFIHGWAAGYLARAGRPDRETKLTLRGPYRHFRHPYYFSHMLMDLGFFLTAGLPFWYLLYFPCMFGYYRNCALEEESFLEDAFGDEYRQFMEKIPRWGVRLIPTEPRGHDETFTWSDYLWNNELKRTLSHLFVLGVFLDFYMLGNPFLNISLFSRATIIGFIASWVFLRDVEFESGGGVAPIWGVSGGLFLLAGLSAIPFWSITPVSGEYSRLLSLGSGIGLLAVLITNYLPVFRNRFPYFYTSTFKNFWLVPLILSVGLGFLVGSAHVFWSGALVTIGLRMLSASGILDGQKIEDFAAPADPS
ncbi:MAG: isoprenylcysteine carboxylmethyltransferase family protein [bacterium]